MEIASVDMLFVVLTYVFVLSLTSLTSVSSELKSGVKYSLPEYPSVPPVYPCVYQQHNSDGNTPFVDRQLHRQIVTKETTFGLQLPEAVKDDEEHKACVLDFSEALAALPEINYDKLHFTLSINCLSSFHVYLFNPSRIKRPIMAAIHVTGCSVYWNDIALFASSTEKFWSVFLTETRDTFHEELIVRQIATNLSDNQCHPYHIAFANVDDVVLYDIVTTAPFPAIFSDFCWSNLATLTLRKTRTSSIPVNLSVNLPNLQGLFLSGNTLSSPPAHFPWNSDDRLLPGNLSFSDTFYERAGSAEGITIDPNQYSRFIKIHYNTMRDLSAYEFEGYLHKISLVYDGIEILGNETFRRTDRLQVLDLTGNVISYISPTLFTGLQDLVRIELSDNRIFQIMSGAFSNMQSLVFLNFENNTMVRLDDNVFFNLPKLKELNLAKNSISYIGHNAFASYSSLLERLNLSNNLLTVIPDFLFTEARLIDLDLSFNSITFSHWKEAVSRIDGHSLVLRHLNPIVGYTVQAIREKIIRLQNNNITGIDLSLFSYSEGVIYKMTFNLFQYHLANNPINCDCRMFEMHNYLNEEFTGPFQVTQPNEYNIENIKCFLPSELNQIPVSRVQRDLFQCPVHLDQCPSKCTCYRRSSDQAVTIDCSNRALTSVPITLPENTVLLNLEYNKLTSLDQIHQTWQNLTSLLLAHNNITHIDGDGISSLMALELLTLNSNRLEYIPKSIRHLNASRIYISKNPIACDCHSTWLKYWLLENGDRVLDFSELWCSSGKAVGKHVIRATDSEFVCELSRGAVIAIVMGVLLFLALIILLLILYWKEEIRLFLYINLKWKPKEYVEQLQDKQYDAFLSYEGEDYQWVCNVLRARFETLSPPYKFCLHDRDFILGTPIAENISNAVESSRHMIVVLSRNYVESEWCMKEFNMAYEKVLKGEPHYLIVIMYEDIPKPLMEETLKKYVNSNTYLDINSTWFWEKLAYVLPQTPLSGFQSAISPVSESCPSLDSRNMSPTIKANGKTHITTREDNCK